jgi:chromosome segregation ATPase
MAALQEQLADARSDVERLQREAANATARARSALEEAASLRGEVQVSDEARASVVAEVASLREQLDAAAGQARTAAERYRDLVVRTEPSLPDELIFGEDADAIDASVTAAREIVGRVRTHMSTQAASGRTPAGAPARAAPDLSALTPEQKIRHGLRQREG